MEKETTSPMSMLLAGLIWDKVKSDSDEAFKEYMRSAKMGCKEAQFFVAFFYPRGIGVSLNQFRALKWYKKSAKAGKVSAMNNLGVMYMEGLGTLKNKKKGFVYLRCAADQGSTVAAKNIAIYATRGALSRHGIPFTSTRGFSVQDITGSDGSDIEARSLNGKSHHHR